MMMMPMWFWNGYELNAFLFKNWSSDTKGQYFTWLAAIFVASVMIEVLLWARTAI